MFLLFLFIDVDFSYFLEVGIRGGYIFYRNYLVVTAIEIGRRMRNDY